MYCSRCWVRMNGGCAPRALPVTTKRSQVGVRRLRLRAVTISTWSPLASWVRSGTMRPLILAPTQLSPT
jgi:hypothetical protein